jgi:hypothetical protein
VKTFGGQLLHRLFMFFVALIGLFIMLRNGRSIANSFLTTSERLFGIAAARRSSPMTQLGTVPDPTFRYPDNRPKIP